MFGRCRHGIRLIVRHLRKKRLNSISQECKLIVKSAQFEWPRTVFMALQEGEVVLITGASGFLAGHLLKLLEKDESVREIRGLDIVPRKMPISGRKSVKLFQRDLTEPESCREVVRGVDVVFHCAAYVSYEFPADKDQLHKNNVLATENLINLCLEEAVPRLVHCSSSEVTLQSCIKGGIVALVIYSQESKTKIPVDESRLIFGEYAASKLRAEKLVLDADQSVMKNGLGTLRTASLRPTLLYGEGDTKLVSNILRMAKMRNYSLIRPAGAGGKQQLTYAGNAAWSLICAKRTLKEQPEAIGGLPIIITDDTPVEDMLRFCQRITRGSKHHVKFSWTIPMCISYALAFLTELAATYLTYLKKIPVLPRGIISYLGSVILYNRIRASIHMDYSPIFSADEAFLASSAYYCEFLDNIE